jgi:penicillin-binding protein 1C
MKRLMHVLKVNGWRFINRFAFAFIKALTGRTGCLLEPARAKKNRRLFVYMTCSLTLFLLFWHCLPSVLFSVPYSTVVVDRESRLLGAMLAADEQWRFPPRHDIPVKLAQALVCYEDQRFYSHSGVDWLALGRALQQNLSSGRVISGASTLSMQVIRLSRKKSRTIPEKLLELLLALRLEWTYPKAAILALFASHAPFGGNIVGIDAASWRYFGKEPDRLSWAESAMLAVLPNSPALIHPGKNRALLLQKRNFLLNKLQQRGFYDQATCRLAQAEPLPPAPYPLPMLAPHLLVRLKESQKQQAAQTQRAPSAIVTTTIDYNLQQQAARVVTSHHGVLSRLGIHNAAALIAEVDTGEVLAYVGNVTDKTDRQHGSHVDIIRSSRSTGSILKPLLYAAMVHEGQLLPEQLVTDIPTNIGGYTPENHNESYRGAVPAYMVLARSINVPSVRMLRDYGIDRFYAYLKNLGMTTLFRPAGDYGLTLILGGAEGTLWDITGMYAGLARTVNHYLANERKVADYQAPELFYPLSYLPCSSPVNRQTQNRGTPSLSPAACWLTLEAMVKVERPGADNAWQTFSSSQVISWKTGTSQGYRDTWAIGVTPRYVVGVWVGNADGEGNPELFSSSTSAPLLFGLFDLLEKSNWFPKPVMDFRSVEICAQSGFLAGPQCATRQPGDIPRSAILNNFCPYCQLIHLDKSGRWQVSSRGERVVDMLNVPWFVLPPAQEWYYRRYHTDYKQLPPVREDCRDDIQGRLIKKMNVIYPEENSQIFVPTELNGRKGRFIFEAVHREPEARIFWHLDEEYLGITGVFHQMELAPPPGKHTLTLIDAEGEVLTRHFRILAKE